VTPVRTFGERGSAPGRLNEPRGASGWTPRAPSHVADNRNHRWQKFDRNGKPSLNRGRGERALAIQGADGDCRRRRRDIYVADTWNHRIQKFDGNGAFLAQWGGGEGGFWAPKGMDFDGAGYLYVVDTGRNRVQKFTREGKFLLAWGQRGEEPAVFSEPVGIAIERDAVITPADKSARKKEVRGDIVYVADTANKRVQTFARAGDSSASSASSAGRSTTRNRSSRWTGRVGSC
jgi:hypothetical protein